MTDAAYFAQREEAERALAKAALTPIVRDIHLDLASRYAVLAKSQLLGEPVVCSETTKQARTA